MKASVWLTLVALLSSGVVDCAAQSPASYRGALTVTVENDVATGSDNNYTNGVGVTWVSDAIDTYEKGSLVRRWGEFWSFLPFVGNEGYRTYVSWSLAQEMHTPDDIRNPNPPKDDQPYAGVLYLDSTIYAKKDRWVHAWQLRVGVVGPASQAENVQKWFHQLDRLGRADGLGHAASKRANPQRRLHRHVHAGPRGLGQIGLVESHSGGQRSARQLLHRCRTRSVRRGRLEPGGCHWRNSPASRVQCGLNGRCRASERMVRVAFRRCYGLRRRPLPATRRYGVQRQPIGRLQALHRHGHVRPRRATSEVSSSSSAKRTSPRHSTPSGGAPSSEL